MPYADMEKARVYARNRYASNRDAIRARTRFLRKLRAKEINARQRERYYLNHDLNKAKRNSYQKKFFAKLRREVISAYGGKCVCCGETEIGFLSIDHIDGNGAAHRREIGLGNTVYCWLKRHGFPKDNFRILCYNCNLARAHLGYCPHEKLLANS